MRERLDNILGKLKEINAKISKRNRILIISGVVALLVLAVVGAIVLNSQPYDTLFSSVNQQEASEIVTALQELGVTAKYGKEGDISVPKDQVDSLRAQLVMQGYPKSGLTYDTFSNNVDMMSTDFDKKQYRLFDLQDRLGATIRRFDGVKDATVTLAEGTDSNYVQTEDKVKPSGTVAIVTQNGATLDEDTVKGIQRLVAKSLPGMSEEDVLVTDNTGRDLTEMGDMSQTGSSKLKLALEHEMESTMQSKVMTLLTPIFGEDKVRVTAKCTMDIDKKIKEIVTYLPTTDDNKGVMKKETRNIEIVGQGTAEAGVVGTDSNAQVPVYPNITTDGSEIYYKDDESFDYLVSQVKEQIQSDAGVVSDLAVSVVVDGQDLNQTELAEMKRLVAITAGISPADADEKVAVFRATFAEDPGTPTKTFAEIVKEKNLVPIGIALLAVLLIIGVIALIIRRKLKARKEAARAAAQAAEEEAALAELRAREKAERDRAMVLKYDEEKQTREQELREEVQEFADKNPEISAQLIKTWLRGGDVNGE